MLLSLKKMLFLISSADNPAKARVLAFVFILSR